jgi:VWFA-related protein
MPQARRHSVTPSKESRAILAENDEVVLVWLKAQNRLSRSKLGLALLLVCLFPAQPFSGREPAEKKNSSQQAQPAFTIRARTNEVLVRVVVRDREGEAVPNLTRDDFRLLDNGKPQTIGQFSTERSGSQAVAAVNPGQPPAETPAEQRAPSAPPNRFVAFYFDDVYLSVEDMQRTRVAAEHYLSSSLDPRDRVGIFTSSGLRTLDFTSDRKKLEEALARLSPHPAGEANQSTQCPYISAYEAYLISEQENQEAIDLDVSKMIQCMCQASVSLSVAIPGGTNAQVNPCPFDPYERVKTTARGIWERAQTAMLRSLDGVHDLVRRLSKMPGQRMIVWVSPGFLGMNQNYRLTWITDEALRARVVINALDSRGLWTTVPGGDATRQAGNLRLTGRMLGLETAFAQTAKESDSAVLEAAATATGGVFVHDTNDYDSGFRKAGGLPEVAYLLSFTPQNLKYDGKYHKLTVKLVKSRGLSLLARKGYFAPSEAPNSQTQDKEDIENEVYARDERTDLPLGIQMRFSRTSELEGQLSVVAQVDLHGAALRKEQEVNVDELHFVTALFDNNGNLLEGQSRVINLRFRDSTLGKVMAGTGALQTAWRFTVKPGTYVVREVVRDGGSGGIAAVSRTVDIPSPN